jgi:hypothetical protein
MHDSVIRIAGKEVATKTVVTKLQTYVHKMKAQ